MKKMYIICYIFITVVVVFYFTYNYSKHNMGLNHELEERTRESESQFEIMTQTAYNEIKISNLTVIKLQTYDLNNNTFEEEKINTPVNFLGMGRSDLLLYMQEYLKEPDKEDIKRGLKAFELVKFSNDEVVLRKTYQMEEVMDEYYAVLENGYVTIYLKDESTIYDYTDIAEADLPDYLVLSLKNGLHFHGLKELYEFLETYSS